MGTRENSSGRGVFQHYGTRTTDETGGGVNNSMGRSKSISYKFSYDDLPGGSTDDTVQYIPAGAVVKDCYVLVTEDFAGGTDYNIGLEQSDGSTAIGADELFDAISAV